MQGTFRTKYENQRFGELLRRHLQRYKTEKDMQMKELYGDIGQKVGKRLYTIQGHMASYCGGNLLGAQGHLTQHSIVSPEARVNDLLHVLYVIEVDEDSEMIQLVRGETRFDITYPPEDVARLSYALSSKF